MRSRARRLRRGGPLRDGQRRCSTGRFERAGGDAQRFAVLAGAENHGGRDREHARRFAPILLLGGSSSSRRNASHPAAKSDHVARETRNASLRIERSGAVAGAHCAVGVSARSARRTELAPGIAAAPARIAPAGPETSARASSSAIHRPSCAQAAPSSSASTRAGGAPSTMARTSAAAPSASPAALRRARYPAQALLDRRRVPAAALAPPRLCQSGLSGCVANGEQHVA
jgi:hypothetical protein